MVGPQTVGFRHENTLETLCLPPGPCEGHQHGLQSVLGSDKPRTARRSKQESRPVPLGGLILTGSIAFSAEIVRALDKSIGSA